MKVVIATPFYPPEIGVLANYASGIEVALKARGHVVEVVSFGALKNLPGGVRHFAYFLKILCALRGARFVLALDTWSVGVPTLYAARLWGTPLIVRIGGDFLWEHFIERTKSAVRLSDFYTSPRELSSRERLIRRMTENILAYAKGVLFNTQFQKNIWEAAYAIPAGQSSVLENFYPPRQTPLPENGRVFVNANRNTLYKNHERLEHAFGRVKARHPEIAIDERRVPHEEQLLRLARAYAVIIPSISEVGSNIAIEAVTGGRPFIITDDTGTKERLADCGIFVDTRSEEAIEQALEEILDARVYAKLQQNIGALSFTHSWDDIATEILQKI